MRSKRHPGFRAKKTLAGGIEMLVLTGKEVLAIRCVAPLLPGPDQHSRRGANRRLSHRGHVRSSPSPAHPALHGWTSIGNSRSSRRITLWWRYPASRQGANRWVKTFGRGWWKEPPFHTPVFVLTSVSERGSGSLGMLAIHAVTHQGDRLTPVTPVKYRHLITAHVAARRTAVPGGPPNAPEALGVHSRPAFGFGEPRALLRALKPKVGGRPSRISEP